MPQPLLRALLCLVGAVWASSAGSPPGLTGGSQDQECAAALVLSPTEFRPFTLRAVTALSRDTKALLLALPPDQTAGFGVASLVMVQGRMRDGSLGARPYTPTSPADQRGSFELVVKGYEEGNVSAYLCGLQAGDVVHVKGPFPKFMYEPNARRSIGMLAGGTGLTPMLQILHEVLRNPEDRTQMTLVLANREEQDILKRALLDELVAAHPRLRVVHVLSSPDAAWTGERGRVTRELIQRALPAPADDGTSKHAVMSRRITMHANSGRVRVRPPRVHARCVWGQGQGQVAGRARRHAQGGGLRGEARVQVLDAGTHVRRLAG